MRPNSNSVLAAFVLAALTGDSLLAVKPAVQLVETPIHKAADGWQITLPRHSLTAVEIEPQPWAFPRPTRFGKSAG